MVILLRKQLLLTLAAALIVLLALGSAAMAGARYEGMPDGSGSYDDFVALFQGDGVMPRH